MNVEISSVPHRESITRLHIPPGKRPQIYVTDALESNVVWRNERCVEVCVQHGTKPTKIELLINY